MLADIWDRTKNISKATLQGQEQTNWTTEQPPDLYPALLKASSAEGIPCLTSLADPRDGTGPLPVF